MQVYHLPPHLTPDSNVHDVIIRSYTTTHDAIKNRIVLHRNMINIIIDGKKLLYHTDGHVAVHAGELLVLTAGNCLTTEVLPLEADFRSILLYFSNETLLQFFIKQGISTNTRSAGVSFIKLKQDGFIAHYAASLGLLLQGGLPLSPALTQVKLEELLLYIMETCPDALPQLEILHRRDDELTIKRVAENNICTPVTVEELAFLCNCSVSTFKRKFEKIYHTSPQKWLLEQKLVLAAELLQQTGESPSTVYIKVGYENHSSFSQAFKQRHGVSPKDFQQQYIGDYDQ